jgi:hypothetical protein
MVLSLFLVVLAGILIPLSATSVLPRDTALTQPSSGSYFEVRIRNDSTFFVNDGARIQSLRADAAHGYSYYVEWVKHCDNMTLWPQNPHTFSFTQEGVTMSGLIGNGSLAVSQETGWNTSIAMRNILFRDKLDWGNLEHRVTMEVDWSPVISIIPNVFPPTDGTILSDFDWRWQVDYPAFHLFMRRNNDQKGVLRFGGPRPEHSELNVTTTPDECHTIVPMSNSGDQQITSFAPTVQVDLFTHNGYSIYDDDETVNPQGYQIDSVSGRCRLLRC